MRRLLYICLLRLHPASFRRQFAGEMLAIFDDPASRAYSCGLFADAMVSLLRQWVLRPQFRDAAADVPVPAVAPLFTSFEDYRLRPGAFLYGGLLTVILLCSVVLAIGNGGIASRWQIGTHRKAGGLLPALRSSMEGPEPDTWVVLSGRKDPWRALASLYFGQIRVLEALDADGDLAISAPEIAHAQAALLKLDTNRDGKLSPEECGFFTGSSGLNTKLVGRIRKDFMRFHPVLAVLDSDRDGEISAAEIRNSSQSLRRLDINGDGSLSPPEVLPDQTYPWAASILGAFDVDHDGQISAAERERSASFSELLTRADRNHDGFTTMDELTKELLLSTR